VKLIGNLNLNKINFILILNLLFGLHVFISSYISYSYTNLFISTSTEVNMELTSSFMFYLEIIMLELDNGSTVTDNLSWLVTFGHPEIYENFLSNLFTLQEMDLLIKTFKEFEGLTNIIDIEKDIRELFLTVEIEKNEDMYYYSNLFKTKLNSKQNLFHDEFMFDISLYLLKQLSLIDISETIL
jgi:hypothetical protein